MPIIDFKIPTYSAIDELQYRQEKKRLQIELLKLQSWVMRHRKKVVVLFEGRDAAGKGSAIKRFTEHLRERKTTDDCGYRVVSLGVPTALESRHWLPRYEQYLPQAGELVFFDRSWYNRALIEPTMNYCSDRQYREFMAAVNGWERALIEQDITLIKFYLSIDRMTQWQRIHGRKSNPLKSWKLSRHDLAVLGQWDVFTHYETQMLADTSPWESPWVVIDANHKMSARLCAMHYVLQHIDYHDVAGERSEEVPQTLYYSDPTNAA